MGSIVVFEHLTLDGVMQAPGRPDEDRRGGFAHGGWARPNNDAVMGSVIGSGMAGMGAGGLLLGRRTYEDFAAVWPKAPRPNPFSDLLDATRKFVASTTLRAPLAWQNSTLLAGDAAEAVAELKRGMDLVVLGSGELVRSLMRHDLVDEFVLLVHPLVLGSGRRLFPDEGATSALELVDTKTTTKGVVIATYRPLRAARATMPAAGLQRSAR